jgi:sigma-B regulation protein RsbU (phosphoserine phosphatase)
VRMLQKETLSDRGRMALGLMDGSLVRAAGLIDNVLDFARGRLSGGITLTHNRGEPLEPVLRQVVEELRSIAPEQIVDANFALAEPIECDHVRIGQMLSNLLGNALTHGAKDHPVRVEAITASNKLMISVTNSGTQIPPEALARLFQPFYRGEGRAQHHGLGLGLHIASEIAHAHGGKLAVRSDAIETSFTFIMPLIGPDTIPA